jgi:hypothetical protein
MYVTLFNQHLKLDWKKGRTRTAMRSTGLKAHVNILNGDVMIFDEFGKHVKEATDDRLIESLCTLWIEAG